MRIHIISLKYWYYISFILQIHNFTHQRYGQPDPRHMTEEQQRNHIKKFVKMNNHQQQLAYDRHVHFIDFRNFIGNSTGNYQPIWFSVIRDPIEKFVSRYNYNRYLFEFFRTAYSQDKRVGISKKLLFLYNFHTRYHYIFQIHKK